MATRIIKAHCVNCGKERSTSRCAGCSQDFCFKHLVDHRQGLSAQLDEIEMNRDIFRQTLNEQTSNLEKHSLAKQIDKWENDSIRKIQKTAKECRQLLFKHTTENIHQTEINLAKLTDQIKQIRNEDDFNETDLFQFKQKLTQLAKELDNPLNVSIQQDSESLINKISVIVSSRFGYNQIGPQKAERPLDVEIIHIEKFDYSVSMTETKNLSVQKSVKGPFTIDQVDPQGNFIVVDNSGLSSKNQEMKGWTIRRKVDRKEDMIYKFPDSYVLAAQTRVRILSRTARRGSVCDREVLLADGIQTWGVGSNMATRLFDAGGEEKAILTHRFH